MVQISLGSAQPPRQIIWYWGESGMKGTGCIGMDEFLFNMFSLEKAIEKTVIIIIIFLFLFMNSSM
jgi:hypothetical protein